MPITVGIIEYYDYGTNLKQNQKKMTEEFSDQLEDVVESGALPLSDQEMIQYLDAKHNSYLKAISIELRRLYETIDQWLYAEYENPDPNTGRYTPLVKLPKHIKIKEFFALMYVESDINDNINTKLKVLTCIAPPDPIPGTVLYRVWCTGKRAGSFEVFWDLPSKNFFLHSMDGSLQTSPQAQHSLDGYVDGSLQRRCTSIRERIVEEVKAQA